MPVALLPTPLACMPLLAPTTLGGGMPLLLIGYVGFARLLITELLDYGNFASSLPLEDYRTP